MKHYIIRHTVLFVILLIANSLLADQITGVIYYQDNDTLPMPGVTVELYSGNNLVATTLTNPDGEFVFSGLSSGDYTITSYASLSVGNIDIEDAALVLGFLNGNSPTDYEFEASDVNGNGNLNYGDYILLTISYLMQGNPFPAGEWQFEELDVNLSSRDSTESVAMWGTSTGDVEGIWMPGGRNIDIIEEEQIAATISQEEVELEIGSSYDDFINGFNLNLTYPVNLIEILDVTGPDENFRFNLDENTGVLNVIWLDESKKPGNNFNGETLFKVKVKQIRNSVQIENGVFSLLEGGMVIDRQSKQIEDITIKLPKFTTTYTSNFDFDFISYPNPVTNNLNIKITNPEDNNASIYIYDMVGRLIMETNNTSIYKGTQVISLDTESLPSGHYIYKVQMQGTDNISGRFYKAN